MVAFMASAMWQALCSGLHLYYLFSVHKNPVHLFLLPCIAGVEPGDDGDSSSGYTSSASIRGHSHFLCAPSLSMASGEGYPGEPPLKAASPNILKARVTRFLPLCCLKGLLCMPSSGFRVFLRFNYGLQELNHLVRE